VPKRNLDEAHNLYSALLRAIVAHPGGSDDPEAMRHVSSLCARAFEAIDDENARSIVRNIETVAGLLFSAAGHVDAQAGSLRGVAALKFHLFNALSNLRGRLQMLQQARPSIPELPALEVRKNQRILVVEDDHDSALSLKKLLELCGYAVTVAFTCNEGLEGRRENAARHRALRHRPAGLQRLRFRDGVAQQAWHRAHEIDRRDRLRQRRGPEALAGGGLPAAPRQAGEARASPRGAGRPASLQRK
jgi:hypothetical protein